MSGTRTGGCFLEIEFDLKPGKRREFARFSEELQGKEGVGHLRSTVYEDVDKPGHMIRVSDWDSVAALEVYLLGDRFKVLVGGIHVLGTIADCRAVQSSAGDKVSRIISSLPTPGRRRSIQVKTECSGTKVRWTDS